MGEREWDRYWIRELYGGKERGLKEIANNCPAMGQILKKNKFS